MKIMRYIIPIIFLIPYAYAMDLAIVQKEENIFDMLPLEVQGKIIKNIFSLIIREDDDSDEHRAAINKCLNCIVSTEHIDQKTLEKCVLNIPLPLAIGLTYQFHQLQNSCQTEIGNKKFAVRELFALPCKQQDVFVRMANRSVLKYIAEGDLSVDDYQIIETMENENIKKGLTLRLLQGNKITSYARSIGISGTCLAFVLVLGVFFFNIKNRYLLCLMSGSGVTGISIFGVSILLEAYGHGFSMKKVRF